MTSTTITIASDQPHATKADALAAAVRVQALVRRVQCKTEAYMRTIWDSTRWRTERLLQERPTSDDLVWDELYAAERDLEKERISRDQFAAVVRAQMPYAFAVTA
jgi:hypothetical protein